MIWTLVAAAAAQAVVAAPAQPVLRAGTPVPLATVEEVNTKTHLQGARFDLAVRDDVRVGNHIVIPKGALAVGEVTRHVARGPLAKSGRLEIRLLHVTVGDRRIRLDGSVSQKGPSTTGSPVVTGVATMALGALILGRSASVPAGTPITGYVHRDLPLAVASAAPQR